MRQNVAYLEAMAANSTEAGRRQRRYRERLGTPTLLPLDRLVLEEMEKRAAEAGRSTIVCSVVELASTLDAARRSVERSLERLRARGLVTARRQGRGQPNLLTIVRQMTHLAAPDLPAAASRPTTPGLRFPAGYCGDRDAFAVVALVPKFGRERSPLEKAQIYRDHASVREVARLNGLCDERGLFEEGHPLTGDVEIDEGLRQLAVNEYRKKMQRQRALHGRPAFGVIDDSGGI